MWDAAISQTVFEKDSDVFHQAKNGKKRVILLTKVVVSACPVETLAVTRPCRINLVGLVPTAKHNSSKKGHQH